MSNCHKPNTNEPVHRGTFTPTKPSASSLPAKLAINSGKYEQQSSQLQTQGPSGRVGGPYRVPDDRCTVDDPPEEGTWVYKSSPTFHLHLHHRSGLPDWALQFDLENGTVHRTRESAEAHAVRMYMVDEILEALETFVALETSVDVTGTAHLNAVLTAQRAISKAHAILEAKRVIAKAWGEVEG